MIHYYKQANEEFGIAEFGWSSVGAGLHVGPHRFHAHLLHFNLRGSVSYQDGTAAEGQAFLIPRKTTYEFETLTEYEHYWFGFFGTRADDILRDFRISPETGCVLDVHDAELCASVLSQAFAKCRSANDERIAMAAFFCLLSLCSRAAAQSKAATDVEYAAELMKKDYASDVKISDIAAAVRLEPKYFSRKFKNRFGVTPMEYLSDIRIGKACGLLSVPGCSIKEVAFYVGYRSPLAFNVAFHKKMGMSPSDYRAAKSAPD